MFVALVVDGYRLRLSKLENFWLCREYTNDLERRDTLAFFTKQLAFDEMRPSSDKVVNHLQAKSHYSTESVARKETNTYAGVASPTSAAFSITLAPP